jgi:hypothetical protein
VQRIGPKLIQIIEPMQCSSKEHCPENLKCEEQIANLKICIPSPKKKMNNGKMTCRLPSIPNDVF